MFAVRDFNDVNAFLGALEALATERQGRWVFRGEENVSWVLSSALERAFDRFAVRPQDRQSIERRMVREFQRRLHTFMEDVPEEDALDEWLALMQHHGAPTRLLDFTYSPYVAAFFALENAGNDGQCAVWAVDTDWCEERLRERHQEHYGVYYLYQRQRTGESFQRLFWSDRPVPLVLSLNPFRLNQRLVYQKGAFLCQGDIGTTFLANLDALTTGAGPGVVKFCLATGQSGENRDAGLRRLFLMNIERATLFPDLDGFARSLNTKIVTLFQGQRW
jgi:hypothetical protein